MVCVCRRAPSSIPAGSRGPIGRVAYDHVVRCYLCGGEETDFRRRCDQAAEAVHFVRRVSALADEIA